MDVWRKFFKNGFFAALVTLISLSGYAQTIYTWNTGIGNWNTAANWLPNGVPGANDNAIINSGTVLLSTNVTVSGLTLAGGTIYGAGKLSIAGAFTWSGGDMDGDTTLAGIDTTEVLPGGTLLISGLNSKDLRGRVLINNGVATWSDPGNINMRNNSVLLNRSGATFNIQTDATLDGAAPTGGILLNQGNLNKNGSSGTAIIDAVIENSGAINVSAGTLRLKNGGTHTGASFTVSTNRTLQFFEGFHSLDGVTLGGSGTLEVISDSVAIGASGMTINSPGNLEMLGGSLSSSAPVTVNGVLKWSKGTIKGLGTYNINGSLLIQTDNSKTLDGATISLAGAATWSGLGDLRLKNGAVLQTLPGSNFNIQNSAQLDFAVPGGGSFNHAGTLAKTGAGATTIDVEMANNGAININSGTLAMERGSNSSGAFTIAAGAALNIGGGTHTFSPAAAVTGAGNLNFTGTGVSDFNGSYSSSGALAVSAGTVNFNGSFGSNGSTAISGGVLNLNSLSSLANITQGGGTFGGSGNITVSDAYAWNGGAIGGSGNVTVNGSLTISGTTIKTLDGITLANAGTAVVAGAGRIDLKNNAQLLNQAGGNFNIQSDVEIDFATPNGGTFINAGTLTRSVATGDLLIDATFNNNGTFNLNSGSLRLTRGGASAGGTFNISGGLLLQYASGLHSLDNVAFTGTGTVELTGNTGNLQVNGGGAAFDPGISFQVNNGILDGNGPLTVNGPFAWSRGTIGGSGNFNFNGPFSISGDNAKTIDGQTVSNSAALTWTGLGDIRLKNNAVLENQPGGTFNIQSDAQIDFAVPDGGAFVNHGVVNKNNGAGTTVIDVALQNNGGFNIGSGSVNLQRGGNSSGGTFTISAGATLQFNGGVHTLSGVTVNGAGTAVLTGSGTLNALGAGMTLDAPATLNMLSGIFDSDGPTIINGTFNWNTGTLTGSGSFTVNGALNLPGGGAKTLDGLTFNNAGVINLNGTGNLRFANSAVFANQAGGIFDIQTDAGLEFIAPAGGVVNNYGSAIKTNGGGTTNINVDFNNYGFLDANSGKMTFTKTLLNDVAGTLQGTDTIGVATATFLNNGNVKPGSSPGMLTISGTYPQSAAGTLHIEVGGYTPGVQYDRLKVVGAAQLSGTLKVVLANNFVPAIGDTFKVMSYTSRVGQFAAFVPPTIGGQPMFDLEYKSTGVVLHTLQVNQLPAANDDHINTSEDLAATLNALANDLDPDGDAISISFFSQPLHGAASQVGDSSFQYVPAENYFGPDTFRYAIIDDNGASDTARVTVTVLPVNDPPAISSPLPDVSFPEDSSATLNLTPYASDVDNSVEELSWSAEVIAAQFLSATQRNALPAYEAELRTIARSETEFRNEKGFPNLQSSPLPAVGQAMFNVQSPIEVDPEDLQITIDPATGIAAFSATLDSSGVFTVVLTVSDPGGLTDSDTITVTVSALGDPPFVANPIGDVEFPEDSGPVIAAANLHEVFSDPDPGTAFSFSAFSDNPGILPALQGDSLAVSSSLNFFGAGSVIVSANDGTRSVVSDTFAVTITPVNDPPAISGIPNVTFPEDSSYTLDLDDWVNDADNDPGELSWSAQVIGAQSNGLEVDTSDLQVSIDPLSHLAAFTATLDSTGLFTVEFSVSDPAGLSDIDTMLVTVTGANDPPFVVNPIPDLNFPEDGGPHLAVDDLNTVFFDPDPGSGFVFTAQSDNPDIQIAVQNDSLWVDGSLNYFGGGTAIVTADDGVFSISDTFAVAITPVNDPPAIINLAAAYTIAEDDTLAFDLDTLAADIDDPVSSLAWEVEVLSGGGASDSIQVELNMLTRVLSIIPDPNYYVSNLDLRFTVCDVSNDCDQQVVALNVLPVNDPPMISGLPDSLAFTPDSSASLNIWDFTEDVETPDSLLSYTFTVSTNAVAYSYSPDTGLLILIAQPGFVGEAFLTIKATDPENAFAQATLRVVVNPVVGIIEPPGGELPREFALQQNYPNPFNPETRIKFQLPAAETVTLTVYNVLGQKVRTLVNARLEAGFYEAVWNGLNEQGQSLASGVYIYRIEAGSYRMVRRMVLMK